MSRGDCLEGDGQVWIDWRALSSEALQGVLEDLVTRNEPDETSLERRCQQLYLALKKDAVRLVFDTTEASIFLLPAPGRPIADSTETSLPG